MCPAKFLKRPVPRYSRPSVKVVTLILAVILPVDADGKSVLFQEAAINQTPFSTDYKRFHCWLLSLIVSNFSAYLTTGFMCKLYLYLSGSCKARSGFLPDQFCDALKLEGVSNHNLNYQLL